MLAVNDSRRAGRVALPVHNTFPAGAGQLQIANEVNTAAAIGHCVGHLRIGA